MKIAMNGTFWNHPTTGSGQYVRALLRALLHRDFDNDYTLIVPQTTPVHELENVPPCVVVQSVPIALNRISDNLGKVWFEQVAFGKASQRERVTLAHVPYFAPPFFSRVPIVVTIHDLIPMILPLYRGSLLVRAYTQLAAAGARRAQAIIADSECSKRDIVRQLGIDPDRVHVIYLAADERFEPVTEVAPIDAIRRKYVLPEKTLLYLGGYDQRKNIRVIIQAFARVPEFYRLGYRLVLAGAKRGEDSEFFPDPRRIAQKVGLSNDAICYVDAPSDEDKPALYASATAFLFPSLYEGFGLPPLEAMACGTPVISSNASSLPEIVGNAAIQVDPNDVDAWADAIRAVLNDDVRRAKMRERGIAQSKKFSWRRTAEQTLAVYESIAA